MNHIGQIWPIGLYSIQRASNQSTQNKSVSASVNMIVSLDSNGAVLKQYTSKVLVQTRKHSIRMRTVHGSDRRGGRGVLPGVCFWGVCFLGVCASPGGVLPGLCFWGCVLRGVCFLGGECASGGVCPGVH